MKFTINGSTWEIQEKRLIDINKEETWLGVSRYAKGIIEIACDIPYPQKIRTLKHELVHVWLYEYGHQQNDEETFTYENVCDIISASNGFINEVTAKYEKMLKK